MPDELNVIAICGAGSMGGGIAQIAAQAGHQVVVFDRDESALERGAGGVLKGAAALVKRGKIDDAEAQALSKRITWTTQLEEFSAADLVIEAIIEDFDIKVALFQAIETVVRPDTMLATNTSSLSVTSLAANIQHADRFLGLHFFNPAPVMKLVEVIPGADTDTSFVDRAIALMSRWGKTPVCARDVPGFIVNRVARPFYGEGWRALEEGAADAASLDFLYRALAGFRMGPFELGDLIGHDINNAAARSIFEAYHGRTRFAPSVMQSQYVDAGRLGRKVGRGVFEYSDTSEKSVPSFCPTADRRALSIRVGQNAVALRALVEAAGISPESAEAADGSEDIFVDGVQVRVTTGETASYLATAYGQSCAVFDWMGDPSNVSVIGFAASDERARNAALGLAAALDKQAIELKDRPGLVVFRTLAQLANCAADAVRDQVADDEAIDKAMRYGVNYPFGPLSWANEFGFTKLVASLSAIAAETGDGIYEPSETLRKRARL